MRSQSGLLGSPVEIDLISEGSLVDWSVLGLELVHVDVVQPRHGITLSILVVHLLAWIKQVIVLYLYLLGNLDTPAIENSILQ